MVTVVKPLLIKYLVERLKKLHTFFHKGGLCLDKRTDCGKLAARGDCETNAMNMTETCPATCNKCGNDRGRKTPLFSGCKKFEFYSI